MSIPRHTRVSWENKTEDPATNKHGADSASSRAEKTILLVEDEHSARLVLDCLLKDFGYQVLAASTPAEALKLVDEHDGPVHLLVTDVRLPEMSGDEFAARLRGSQPDLKVVFVSGLPEAPAGASAFLQKPVDFDALTQVIGRVLV